MDDIAESQDLSKEISEAISNPVAFGADVDEVYFDITLQNIFRIYVSVKYICNTCLFCKTKCLMNQLNNVINVLIIQFQIMCRPKIFIYFFFMVRQNWKYFYTLDGNLLGSLGKVDRLCNWRERIISRKQHVNKYFFINYFTFIE